MQTSTTLLDVEQEKSRSESVSCSVTSNSATPWTIYIVHQLHGILQARILEQVAIPLIRGSFRESCKAVCQIHDSSNFKGKSCLLS